MTLACSYINKIHLVFICVWLPPDLNLVNECINISLLLGNGFYIFIETSNRKYDEKARLNSPWMRGPRRMTFYYSMYGSTVESLSVYVRISGSEERIWSRHGNQLTRNWTKGCVAINYNGTYQVEPFYGSLWLLL